MPNKKDPYVSIVIPAINESRNIARVIRGVKRVMKDREYEMIVVDGGSTDKTADISRRLGALVLYDTTGKGGALRKGLEAARGGILVFMDADLSHKPEELKLLIDSIEIGYDICMGSRFIAGGGSEDISPVRRIGNWFFVLLVNLLFNANYTDMCYGYRSFRKEILKRLDLKEKGFGIETEINIKAAKLGLKVIEVPSNEKSRKAGEAKLRTFRDGYIILMTILRNLPGELRLRGKRRSSRR